MGARPPGPPAGFFGLSLARSFQRDPLGFTTGLARAYGDVAAFRMGPIRAWLLNHPDVIREVLVTQAKKFRKQPMLLRLLSQVDGNGLIVTEGDFWLRQRRLVQPAFAQKRMDAYARTIVERTIRRLETWRAGREFEVGQEMTGLTLDIICQALFNVAPGNRTAELGEAVREISEAIVRESSSLIRFPEWLPLPSKRRKWAAIRKVDAWIGEIIRDRRASGRDEGDFLSMLLSAVDDAGDGRGMTDRQVRDEAITLFNAGHDSTAAALTWCWALLGRHPAIVQRLTDEVDAVLQGRPAGFADLPRLPFAEMVVKETMRIYPPTWALLIRYNVEPVSLGGYDADRGTWMYLLPWVTHWDPRFFPHPETFDPDRFGPARRDQIPDHAYLPFGAGPHVCIGQQFATTEMILILATVLQRFRLELIAPDAPLVPEPFIAIRPRGGVLMRVHDR